MKLNWSSLYGGWIKTGMCCRSFLVLWLASIPFVFVSSLQWLTIGFCVIVGYALLGFESFGVEIESPFGRDFNDLPVDKIASGIRSNLMAALDYANTTNQTGAVFVRQKIDQMRQRRSSVYVDVWGRPEIPTHSSDVVRNDKDEK